MAISTIESALLRSESHIQTSTGFRSNPPFSCCGSEPALHSPRNSENHHLHEHKFYSIAIAIATLVYESTCSFPSRVRNRSDLTLYAKLIVVHFLSFPGNNREGDSWTNRSFRIRKEAVSNA